MNKPSEPSNPFAWEIKGIPCRSEEEKPDPACSKEYASALDDAAKYWIGQSAEWKERAEAAEAKLMVKEQEVAFFLEELERRRDVKKAQLSECEGRVIPEGEPKKSEHTKWSTLLLSAGFVYLSGFLLTLGFFSAAGWVEFIGKMIR